MRADEFVLKQLNIHLNIQGIAKLAEQCTLAECLEHLVPLIRELLQDPEADIRMAALQQLKAMGERQPLAQCLLILCAECPVYL